MRVCLCRLCMVEGSHDLRWTLLKPDGTESNSSAFILMPPSCRLSCFVFILWCYYLLLNVGCRWLCSGLRRLPLTPWETNVVTRLQQPTHSYLARSRSAMSLSGDHAGNVHARGEGGGVYIYRLHFSLLTRTALDANQIWVDLRHYTIANCLCHPVSDI